tara:strand:+ start:383 stop:967 length:585 start_codon:yes stop_codon:yes gene_type:complete
MIIIEHRVNTKIKLSKISPKNGVEIDLRTNKNKIILSHDPFKNGISLEEWLKFFKHDFLVLNVKEDGLESEILDLLKKNKIERFFFLDQSFPSIIKSTKANEKRCAIRISEYESIETAVSLRGKVEWIWIDHFSKFPLNFKEYKYLIDLGFKTCIVSPELQNGNLDIAKELRNKLSKENIRFNAVCTKNPEIWF